MVPRSLLEDAPRLTNDELAAAVRDGRLTADELLQHYCTLVYAELGSYEKAARRLDIDRRTVRSKIDEELLAQLKAAPC